MSKLVRVLRSGVAYAVYFLRPMEILRTLRILYISTQQRHSDHYALNARPLALTVVHTLLLCSLMMGSASFFTRHIGRRFHFEIAGRVALGLLGLSCILTAIGAFATARSIRGRPSTPESKPTASKLTTLSVVALPSLIPGCLWGGLTGELAFGSFAAGWETAIWALLFTQNLRNRVITAYSLGFAYGVTVFTLGRIGIASPGTILRDAALGLGGAFLLLIITALASAILNIFSRNRLSQAEQKWPLITTIIASALFAWIASFKTYSDIIAVHPFAIAAVSALIVTRAPLWPFEALWAAVRLPSLLHEASLPIAASSNTQHRMTTVRNAFRSAFFDQRQMLPLPGEMTALIRIGAHSPRVACEEAIELLAFSPRRSVAGATLLAIAQQSPLEAHAPIWKLMQESPEFQQLFNEIASNLSGGARSLWNALGILRAAAEDPDIRRGLLANHASRRESGEQSVIVRWRAILAEAVPLLHDAAHDPDPVQGAAELEAFFARAARELDNESLDTIAPLPVVQISFQYQANEFMREIAELCEPSSPLVRRNRLLAALASQRNEKLADLLRDLQPFMDDLNWRDASSERPAMELVARVVQAHWNDLLLAEAERLAHEQPVGPIESPYVIGPPVLGALFVGRDRLFDELQSIWGDKAQWPSVLLFGHRRMGKSSILHNLPVRFGGPRAIIVTLNLQSLGEVQHSGDVLSTFAREIWRAARKEIATLPEPLRSAFGGVTAYEAFREYLYVLNEHRGGRRLVLAIDEYELIDRHLRSGAIDERLIEFLRAMLDQHPWLCLVFAGLHEHTEFTGSQWQHLFRVVLPIRVSFLDENAGNRLLAEPTPDFPVAFAKEALALAHHLTNGQPFLLQLLGHCLINRLNERRRTTPDAPLFVTEQDVEETVADDDFLQRGMPYFDGIRREAEAVHPAAIELLRCLAASPDGMTNRALAEAAGLDLQECRAALTRLRDHEIVRDAGEGEVRFTVELMRRFLVRTR